MMSIFLAAALSLILILAAVQDLRFQKIPNLLTYPTMGMGVLYHSVTSGFDGFSFAATGLAAGIGLLLVPYVMGGMGAGDAKLMGAVGAVVGAKGAFIAFLYSAVIGGIYAFLLILVRRQFLRSLIEKHTTTLKTLVFTQQYIPIPVSNKEKQPKLCYGIAIAIGTLLYMSLKLSGYNLIT
jgi:prepilin peptidase CpaA